MANPNKDLGSKFLQINCPRCGDPNTVYGKSSMKIKCEKCNKLLVKTTGGKVIIKAKVRKILGGQDGIKRR